jgi:preprotein translocase subunit SecA
MTGTADTEAEEFRKIYKHDVVVIPHQPAHDPEDHQDVIYKTNQEKTRAVIEEIKTLHEKKRPVLVGTISIEKSELLSTYLTRTGIRHSVLNAKNHEREAEIVAQAGQPGMVTISTNMARRGTDIKLGEGVAELGDSISWYRSATRAAASTTSLRGPFGTPGRPGIFPVFTSPWRRPSSASSGRRRFPPSWTVSYRGERTHRTPPGLQGHRKCPEAGRRPEFSIFRNTSSISTMS